jgi:hypothetical protein
MVCLKIHELSQCYSAYCQGSHVRMCVWILQDVDVQSTTNWFFDGTHRILLSSRFESKRLRNLLRELFALKVNGRVLSLSWLQLSFLFLFYFYFSRFSRSVKKAVQSLMEISIRIGQFHSFISYSENIYLLFIEVVKWKIKFTFWYNQQRLTGRKDMRQFSRSEFLWNGIAK